MAETFTLDEPAETFTIDVPKRRTAMESLKEGAVGAGETALSMASGAIAAPVGGLVGLTNLPFGRERATEQARAVQEALTYAPRTQVGQQQMGMVSYPFTKLSELATRGGENVLEATGSPGLATQAQVAMEAIPYILSRAARPAARSAMARREAALNAEASRNLVANETLRRAQAEGFVVPPSQSYLGRRLTSIGGKAATGQEAAIRNQQVADRIGRREGGLKADEPISEGTLEQARYRMAEPYREVASLSATAKSALAELKEARFMATKYHRHSDISGDPKSLLEARRLDGEASVWEQTIEAEAIKAGRPELVGRLRQARQNIAKNYDVERALNVGTGNIDAQVLGRMLDRGRPLSGGLETVGRFAQAFQSYAREASRIPTPGVSKLEALTSLGLGLGGGAAMGPAGVAMAAIPLVSGPARSLALSPIMQPKPTYRPGLSYSLADIGTRQPEVFGLTPALSRPVEEPAGPWQEYAPLR